MGLKSFTVVCDCVSGLRLNNSPDINLSSVGRCVMLGFGCAHNGST